MGNPVHFVRCAWHTLPAPAKIRMHQRYPCLNHLSPDQMREVAPEGVPQFLSETRRPQQPPDAPCCGSHQGACDSEQGIPTYSR